MAEKRTVFKGKLHDSTRALLAQLTFLALGMLPLMGCLVFVCLQFLPSYHRWQCQRWSVWLSDQMGVEVRVLGVESPAPGQYLLSEIRLTHPETSEPIGRCDAVEVRPVADRWLVRLEHLELESQQLGMAWKAIHDWFVCRPKKYASADKFQVRKLTVRSPGKTHTFDAVSLDLHPKTDALRANLQFRLAASQSAAPGGDRQAETAQLIIKRSHSTSRLLTEVHLDTGATPLPCELLQGVLGPNLQLGPFDLGRFRSGYSPSFQGILHARLGGSSWEAEIHHATFLEVDFARIASTERALLTGSGAMFIEKAKVVDGRLEEALGSMEVSVGTVQHSVMLALHRHLAVEISPDIQQAAVNYHGFDRMAFAFHISPEGLRLAGHYPGGVLAYNAAGWLARRDAWQASLGLSKLIASIDACIPSHSGDSENSGQVLVSGLARRALDWLPLH